ncbi:MAG: hypothetical protein CR984_04285 [Proteobacteria bacterium]|nr:MAG: hypothetical protein CR984_04285 [Pseudomonadota bacterium]
MESRQTGPIPENSLIIFRFRHPATDLDMSQFSHRIGIAHSPGQHPGGNGVCDTSDRPGAKE